MIQITYDPRGSDQWLYYPTRFDMPKKNIGDRDPDHIRQSLEMLYYIYKRTEKTMTTAQEAFQILNVDMPHLDIEMLNAMVLVINEDEETLDLILADYENTAIDSLEWFVSDKGMLGITLGF